MTRDSDAVEFFDPEQDADAVEWLGEGSAGAVRDGFDDEQIGARRGLLPPPTTRHRLLATALAFGLVLGASGFAADSAYRHDQAVEALANTVVLQERPGDQAALPTLLDLGTLASWRVEPSLPIEIPVTNLSPDSVTLLPGGSLSGPGLSATGLRVRGSSRLATGETEMLDGTLTANCAFSGMAEAQLFPPTSVTVPTRAFGGAVRAQTVPLSTSDETLRERVCAAESSAMISVSSTPSYDAALRTVTVTLAGTSRADVPLQFAFTAAIPPRDGFELLGAAGTFAGTVEPGGRMAETYRLGISDCAAARTAVADAFQVDLTVSLAGEDLSTTEFGQDTASMADAVCGFGHSSA